MIRLRGGSATDVGLVRSNNQDHFLIADPLYAVADGMGGAAAGEVASEIAVQVLGEDFARGEATPDQLIQSAIAANRAVFDKAEANPEMRGMGTTLVALALVDGGELAIINIGDSRLYSFRDGELNQVTRDHNLVAEMVEQGRISPEEAEVHPRRNIMTRALGVEPDVPVDLFSVEDPHPGDRFLLCSDGLPREVKDDQIASFLRRLADPGEAARELVEEAKRRGGNDNITVVVVDVGDEEVKDETVALALPSSVAAPDATKAVETPPKQRRQLRSKRLDPDRPRARIVTVRVVGFIALLLLIIGGGAAGVVWYARSGYFVGLRGDQIVIFQGRPGGVLWFDPTVSEVTSTTTAQILPARYPTLEAGQEESSLSAAKRYVQNLVDEKQALEPPTTTTVPTTVPITTPPTTVKKSTTTVHGSAAGA